MELTQQQLAKRVGIHQSEISNIERGAASPGYRTLVKLADGLHADLAFVPRPEAPRHTTKKRSGARRSAPVAEFARRVGRKSTSR